MDLYTTLLAIHSLVRWFVLLGLLIALFISYRGWLGKKAFTKMDDSIRHWTATIAHIQLCVGLSLYFISPVIHFFLHQYKEAVKQNEVRFFGMEHSSMMLIAIILITIGSAAAKRKSSDGAKFKTMAIWFTLALLIILVSIPWPFSSLASRPFWRGF